MMAVIRERTESIHDGMLLAKLDAGCMFICLFLHRGLFGEVYLSSRQ